MQVDEITTPAASAVEAGVDENWWARVSRFPALPFLLLILAVFLIYSSALGGSFVFDDEKQILENPFVLNPHLWTHIFAGSVWSFQGAGAWSNFYRPLMIFSFWLLYHTFGPVPAAFHLLQIALFAASACVLYLIARELLENPVAAFAAAVLWIVHPQRVEAVAWISALCEVGCGLFYFLAFLLFLRAEKAPHHRVRGHVLAAASLLVAFLFKEMAFSFPLLVLAYWFFDSVKASWRRRVAHLTPYLGAVAIYLTVRQLALGHLVAAGSARHPGRLLAAGAALLGQHTKLFFWPAHLSAFRTFSSLSRDLHSPWLWVTPLAAAAAFWLRRRSPRLAFLICWWPIALLPCLDVRFLTLVADRYTYIPAAGLSIAIALVLVKSLPRRFPARTLKAASVAALATIVLVWALGSAYAIPHWRDNQTLVNYSSTQSPGNASLHVVEGWELEYRKKDLAGAAREFRRALSLGRMGVVPNIAAQYEAYVSLGQVLFRQGNTPEALQLVGKAIRILPRRSTAYQVLGSLYFPRGDYARAAAYFAQAVHRDPYDPQARFYLGASLMKLGKQEKAAAEFRAASQMDPGDARTYEAERRALASAPTAARASASVSHSPEKRPPLPPVQAN